MPQVILELLPLLDAFGSVFDVAALHVELLVKYVWSNLRKYNVYEKTVGFADFFLIKNVSHVPIVVGVERSAPRTLGSAVGIWAVAWVAKMYELLAVAFKMGFELLPLLCLYVVCID
jgi:hypothetical protein